MISDPRTARTADPTAGSLRFYRYTIIVRSSEYLTPKQVPIPALTANCETRYFSEKLTLHVVATCQGRMKPRIEQPKIEQENLEYLRENVNQANSYDSATFQGSYTI
jgi:hypothetical protein